MVEIINSYERKARKSHICDFCSEEIKKGEKYNYQYNEYEGEAYSWKSHIECEKVAVYCGMYDGLDEGVTGDLFKDIVNEKITKDIPLSGKIRLLYNKSKGDSV